MLPWPTHVYQSSRNGGIMLYTTHTSEIISVFSGFWLLISFFRP